MAGRDLAEHDHFLLRLAQTLGASSLLLLLLSGVIGHFASGRALIPIRRSFEAQRRFAADASHELRTPLSVIQASLEVVEKEDGAHFSPLSRQIFADLQDETRRMSRLTGNLLTLARYDSGAVETVRKKAGLRGIAGHVFRSLQALARTRELTLQLAMDEDLDIWADPDLITQLLFILLDNGLKFTPPGGRVSLEIQRAREEKGMVALSVSDTGIGLSAEDKERIFERFYRADQARSRETGGAGLGLSIAAWIVKAHEGYIRVEDAKGGGSVFRVLLREAEQGAARGKH
jgi:signal transduction histidine kinase